MKRAPSLDRGEDLSVASAGPEPARRPAGITLLSAFFFAAAMMSFIAALSLFDPEGPLEGIWRVNPIAREGLEDLGAWAAVLFLAVSAACAASSVGLWNAKPWGRRLALGVFAVNLIGDFVNVFLRGDARALIGMPVVGLLMFYLLSARAKRAETRRPSLERHDARCGY